MDHPHDLTYIMKKPFNPTPQALNPNVNLVNQLCSQKLGFILCFDC
jgi:hypothetical protein